jgi:hypothetical protein
MVVSRKYFYLEGEMTNTTGLTELIKTSGFKLSFIAQSLNISRFSLQKKITNQSEFKGSEIGELCRILNIDANKAKEIFFAGE